MKRLMLVAMMLLSGCVVSQPTSIGLSVMHQSQPLRGQGPPPMGDHNDSNETNYEAIGGNIRWETERTFVETDLDYVVHDNYLTGGPWLFTIRAGVQVRL